MFYDATLYMSNSKFVTLSSSIPIYNSLLEHLEKLVDVNDKNYCNSSEVCIAILKGYEKLKTYYRIILKLSTPKIGTPYQNYDDFGPSYSELGRHYVQKRVLNFGTIRYSKTDDSHTYAIATSNYIFQFFFCLIYTFYIIVFFLIYYVSIVIDPRFKLGYYQKQEWEQYYIDAAKKIFTDTFKNFYQDNINDANNRENTNDESDFLFNILGENNNNDYNEAEAYLQQPVTSIKTDPLTWWKVNCMNFL